MLPGLRFVHPSGRSPRFAQRSRNGSKKRGKMIAQYVMMGSARGGMFFCRSHAPELDKHIRVALEQSPDLDVRLRTYEVGIRSHD
jgi:hypothetical protein